MKKKKTEYFVCSECGYDTTKWMGQCPECKAWNSFKEFKPGAVTSRSKVSSSLNAKSELVSLKDIEINTDVKMTTGISELDNVLGGGIVPGSLILLGGEPGIGKSTFLLQLSSKMSEYGKILYNNGEESSQQIKLRSVRLNVKDDNIFLLEQTGLDEIEHVFLDVQPLGAIVDSIQTVYRPEVQGLPGSLSQVKEGANLFLQLSKKKNIFIFLVGHVTKDGQIAGPKTLEHVVDVVLYLEGDKNSSFRILRSYKNRFGSTDEIGVFQMTAQGIEEVKNPSKYFIRDYDPEYAGATLAAIFEGSRPLLIEVQALVSSTHFSFPKRMVDGTDINKAHKLIAILEKVLGLILVQNDVYINITGGLKVKEPGLELALIMAVYSSFKKISQKKSIVYIGEVGLAGEIRGVPGIQHRINEAMKMGVDEVIVPIKNYQELSEKSRKDSKIKAVKNLKDVVELIS